MASVGTNKRRRITSNTLNITDLPTGFLVDVSSYLSKPSRAIFAVAISGSDGYQVKKSISDSSKAIIAASDWDTLDFVDIGKNLAERLTDGDLHAILTCINAIQNLRILKLTNCMSITGRGLGPLRGSDVLKLIDLSLIGKYKSPQTGPESVSLSESIVIYILSRIRQSLRYVQFPYSWTSQGESDRYIQFKRHFVNDFQERNHICSNCNRNVNEQAEEMLRGGHQRNVCYSCLKVICDDCERDDGRAYIDTCTNCRKDYCEDCADFVSCRNCGFPVCNGCKISCQGCENDFCRREACLSNCDCQRMQNLLQAHW